MKIMYPIFASVAGAITALSFRPFKDLTPLQIGMSIFVGWSFAYFLGPFVVHTILGTNNDVRMQGGIYYLLASGSNALIPIAVKWLARAFNMNPEKGE